MGWAGRQIAAGNVTDISALHSRVRGGGANLRVKRVWEFPAKILWKQRPASGGEGRSVPGWPAAAAGKGHVEVEGSGSGTGDMEPSPSLQVFTEVPELRYIPSELQSPLVKMW